MSQNEYIEPAYQLPQRAASLHTLEDLFQCWATAIRQVWDAFLVPIGKLFKRIANVVAQALRHAWQRHELPRKRRHYHVPYRPHKISHKRALIAQRKITRSTLVTIFD